MFCCMFCFKDGANNQNSLPIADQWQKSMWRVELYKIQNLKVKKQLKAFLPIFITEVTKGYIWQRKS